MVHILYLSICAAFLVNAWFLAGRLAARAGQAGWKKSLALAALFAAVFAAGQLFFRGAEPRGGYDNDHDFQYMSLSFFRPGSAGMSMAVKEASPLIFGALGDAAGGFSLRAAPLKNRLLMFLSAALLFACLLALGFGLSSACFGFALFYFNFLSALNADTFATTAANAFFLFSAIYAAAVLETRERNLKGLLWALAALFLVWTGRYELAVIPALMLSASLLRPGGALRALLLRPGDRAPAWLLAGTSAALCAAWALLVLARLNYNGPPPGEALKLLSHLRYQLGEGNLGVFLPGAAPLAPYLAAAAFILTFAKALASPRRGPALAGWTVLLLCALCFSSIFMLPDAYPLQFMRHRLYFFVPFVFLFAAAWEACFERPGGKAAAALKWGALACFCALYLNANLAAAKALEPEKRTNDREWALLLKAERDWPKGCALIFPDDDRHHRRALLEKYFPLVSGDCGRRVPACVIKYLPPTYAVFRAEPAPKPEGYGPADASYAGPGTRPLIEASFAHKFYTGWDFEERGEVPLRIGFYYADNPQDRAWLLNRDGLCAFKNGGYGEAEGAFRQALKLDPGCGVCRINLAAGLVFGGKGAEARRLVAAAGSGGTAGGGTALLGALKLAAEGENTKAVSALDAYISQNHQGEYLSMAFAYRRALTLGSRERQK